MGWTDWFKTEKAESIKNSPTVSIASSGTEIYGGYIQDEYLGELVDTHDRYEIYHRMRTSSGVIKMCVKSVKSSILSSKWNFRVKQGFENDADAVRQLELIKKIMPENELKKLVRDMTTAVTFGFYLGERYFKQIEFEGKTYLAPKVKFISQRTIDQWAVDPVEGWLGVVQRAYGDTSTNVLIHLNSDRLIHFAIDQEGDNYEGISMLRACYGPWIRKNVNYKNVAIGNSFLSLPYLKVFVDKESTRLKDEDVKALRKRLQEREKPDGRYRSHIVFPKGYKADELKSEFDPLKLYQSNEKEDDEIVRAFCANFLLLTKGSGSFALSNDLSKFFMRGLEEIAIGIDDAINKQIIDMTIKINFEQETLIETSHSEVGGKGGKELAEALSKIIGTGGIRPDDTLEAWIRGKFGMPEIDVETLRESPSQEGVEEEEEEEEEGNDKKKSQLNKFTLNRQEVKKQAQRSIERIESLRKNLRSNLIFHGRKIIEKQVKKIKALIDKGKLPKLEEYKASTTEMEKSIFNLVFETANDEITDLGKSVLNTKTVGQMRKRIKRMVSADVASLVAAIDDVTLYSMLEALDSLTKPEDIAAAVTASAVTHLEGAASSAKASVLPAKAVNMARQVSFEKMKKQIVSYTYYNSSPVAAICQLIAGKTLSKEDAEGYATPFHFNCTTVRFANMKHFKNNPRTSKLSPNKKQRESIDF